MGKQRYTTSKTWAECWQQLLDLCSQTSIQFDRSDSELVADMQDAIERIPVVELPKRYGEMTPHQRDHFIFIAGIVLSPAVFTAVMKCTVLDRILTEKEAEVKALKVEKLNLIATCTQQADRINTLKGALSDISNAAFQAVQ